MSITELSFMGYEFRNIKGHFEVYDSGCFILSADTLAEALADLTELLCARSA